MNIPSWIPQWTPSVSSGWATCHFAIAWAIVFTAFALEFPAWMSFAAVIGWGLVKEFTFDLIIERDSIQDSMVDFSWYCVGGAAASVALSLIYS